MKRSGDRARRISFNLSIALLAFLALQFLCDRAAQLASDRAERGQSIREEVLADRSTMVRSFARIEMILQHHTPASSFTDLKYSIREELIDLIALAESPLNNVCLSACVNETVKDFDDTKNITELHNWVKSKPYLLNYHWHAGADLDQIRLTNDIIDYNIASGRWVTLKLLLFVLSGIASVWLAWLQYEKRPARAEDAGLV